MYTDIVCNVTISDAVDTPYTIKYQWFGSSLITNGPDYTITNDTLRINQLSIARDNNRIITCVTTVIPTGPGQRYVIQNNASGSIQLTFNSSEFQNIVVQFELVTFPLHGRFKLL